MNEPRVDSLYALEVWRDGPDQIASALTGMVIAQSTQAGNENLRSGVSDADWGYINGNA